MKVVSYDVETLTFSKGSPYDSRNKLCLAGVSDGVTDEIYDIEYSDTPYREQLDLLRSSLLSADLIVLFNAKFDLNWSKNYGIDYRNFKIWDCQLAHFIITNQTHPYPSLNQVAEYYGLGTKIDKIAEYWDAGIQTNEIDYDELSDYLKQDLNLTLQIYYKQKEEIETKKPHLAKLLNVSMVDILVLAEMEYHGILYDFDLSKKKAEDLSNKIMGIDRKLNELVPLDGINWNSNDHLSAILYGGIIKFPVRESYERTLKDGTVKVRERWGEKEVEMPTLVTPLKGTECAKDGYWKTAEDILRSLKATGKAKQIINLVLERSVLDKELNTYALGIPKLYEEKHYTDNIIHGNYNMCVARTGRLSSSTPNLQNLSSESKQCFISRY